MRVNRLAVVACLDAFGQHYSMCIVQPDDFAGLDGERFADKVFCEIAFFVAMGNIRTVSNQPCL